MERATSVQADVESLSFSDNSFEVVICIYLFHELPPNVRENVAAELAQVVKLGGMVVFTASFQRGDRPCLEKVVGAIASFAGMNEPYYRSYANTYIPFLFEKHGLKCH